MYLEELEHGLLLIYRNASSIGLEAWESSSLFGGGGSRH